MFNAEKKKNFFFFGKYNSGLVSQHDEVAATHRHELLEDVGKVLGHLLECKVDGLILFLVEGLQELCNRLQQEKVNSVLFKIGFLLGATRPTPSCA